MREDNPYMGTEVVPKAPESGAMVEVEQQRAIAETQAAMIIAKRFRRDQAVAMDRILTACTRAGLAEAALYQYSRGGTEITGPSIRLAEAIAQNWENLQFGIRELEQKGGSSTVEAYAWDVENNVRQVKVFQVAHKRYTKKETYALEDPRDIYEMTANQGARRLRSCILGIIPGDVIEAAVKQCEATLKIKAAVTPERIASLLEKFWEYGVTKAQLEKRVQRHIDAITPALMVNLGKIYNSLKDGMSVPADWFEVEQGQEPEKTRMETLKDKLKAQKPETVEGEVMENPESGPQEIPTRSDPINRKGRPAGSKNKPRESPPIDVGKPEDFDLPPPVTVPHEPVTEEEAVRIRNAQGYKDELTQERWAKVLTLMGQRGKSFPSFKLAEEWDKFEELCQSNLDQQNK